MLSVMIEMCVLQHISISSSITNSFVLLAVPYLPSFYFFFFHFPFLLMQDATKLHETCLLKSIGHIDMKSVRFQDMTSTPFHSIERSIHSI